MELRPIGKKEKRWNDSREYACAVQNEALDIKILQNHYKWAIFTARTTKLKIDELEEISFHIAIDFMMEQARFKPKRTDSFNAWKRPLVDCVEVADEITGGGDDDEDGDELPDIAIAKPIKTHITVGGKRMKIVPKPEPKASGGGGITSFLFGK